MSDKATEPERCNFCGLTSPKPMKPWGRTNKLWCIACEARLEDDIARDRAAERA